MITLLMLEIRTPRRQRLKFDGEAIKTTFYCIYVIIFFPLTSDI